MRTSQQPYGTHIEPILALLRAPILKFYAALSAQCPDAIGAIPVQQGSVHGAIIAFDSTWNNAVFIATNPVILRTVTLGYRDNATRPVTIAVTLSIFSDPCPKRGADRVDNKCRHEDHIDPDPLSFFYQTTVGATSSATSTGAEASVAIDKHRLSAKQPSAIAHVELEKVTEKDDSDSSNRPDDDVDDDYSIDLKGTDSMSMGEEEVNELLKNQESSLIELTNARQEHTDNPIVDIQSILTETEHVSTFNTSLL
ncbi:hypothetical protein CU097_009414 [Rhizopus azygosporus]|uniref:Uncharacterized protein n=1 Tax=Rhizopus azygosporus TaxID=86630 RepID=A0A367JFS1_RHIAZ|nr:hypothetical protein CU097_009414 [Rhizopus azygosporus]